MSFQSPLGRARGMGSAKSGNHHFFAIRVSGLALVPLCLWITYAIACLGGASLAEATAFVANPFNAAFLICLIIATFYHSALGVQVVFEDYISAHGPRLVLQFLFNFACFVLAVVSVIAVLKVAVTG